jgi:hypothetical protein
MVGALGSPSAAADCAGVFLFRPNDRLSIQEVASLADADVGEAPNDFILVMTPTDWEEAAYRGDWSLLAVIYAAELGLGDKVVGGTLWTPRREAFGTDGGGAFRAAKDGVYLTIRPVTPIRGCKAGYTFKLDGRGVLFASGVRVGQAKAAE